MGGKFTFFVEILCKWQNIYIVNSQKCKTIQDKHKK